MVEVSPNGQYSVGTGGSVYLVLQSLSVEHLHERLSISSVVLQPLLYLLKHRRVKALHGETLSVRVEEIND